MRINIGGMRSQGLKMFQLNLSSTTPCPQKNLTVCFLAIFQLLLGQFQKVRSPLKSAGSEDIKTVLNFDIWPTRS